MNQNRLAKGYIFEYDKEPELAEKYYKLAVKVGGSVTCYNKLIAFYKKQNLPEKEFQVREELKQKHSIKSSEQHVLKQIISIVCQ